MPRVHKVILDIGLEFHIQGIIQKLNPQVLFIKERNLEIFRLSLFVIDYADLTNNYFVYFAIAENEVQERKRLFTFRQGTTIILMMKTYPFLIQL